jgi:flagellar assembly protein FliH
MKFSKVISKDNQEGTEIWDFPFVGDEITIASEEVAAAMPTVDEIADLQEQARDEAAANGFDEGYAKGIEEGRAAGHAEGVLSGQQEGLQQGLQEGQAQAQAKAELWDQLLSTLSTPLLELDVQVEQQLVSVATLVAKHVVRREIKTDPNQIVGAVRKAVSVLPISARDVRVYLHPEDAVVVREGLAMSDGADDDLRWKIVEDAALTRGGCNVETEHSRIDATVESRLAAVIAQVMGGERGEDDNKDTAPVPAAPAADVIEEPAAVESDNE